MLRLFQSWVVLLRLQQQQLIPSHPTEKILTAVRERESHPTQKFSSLIDIKFCKMKRFQHVCCKVTSLLTPPYPGYYVPGTKYPGSIIAASCIIVQCAELYMMYVNCPVGPRVLTRVASRGVTGLYILGKEIHTTWYRIQNTRERLTIQFVNSVKNGIQTRRITQLAKS